MADNKVIFEIVTTAKGLKVTQRQTDELAKSVSRADKSTQGLDKTQEKNYGRQKQGLIQKNGKVKRAWIWIVKEHKLLELHSNNQSKNNELDLQPELETLTPAVSYKNPKNINKNILREEEEAFAASSLLSDEDKVKALELELNNQDI